MAQVEAALGPATLADRWHALSGQGATLRMRDVANELGVSEAELVATGANWEVVRLQGDLGHLFERLPDVGEVMVLTRNEYAVHEKVGEFGNVRVGPGHGIVLNKEVDLRLFMGKWRHAYEVTDTLKDGSSRRSLQFFDAAGTAVHKIYQRPETHMGAWAKLIADYVAKDQAPNLKIKSLPEPPADLPDADIDVEGLKAHWADLQDVHDFFGLLRDFKVGRFQAMRLVGAPYVEEVQPGAIRHMLEGAAETDTPIMCFVGNGGCIQIHSGPVKNIKVMGPWLNVLDPRFDLHLREDAIKHAFIVRKPTRDGTLSSLEMYGPEGTNFGIFFGQRAEGQPELKSWRAILEDLPRKV